MNQSVHTLKHMDYLHIPDDSGAFSFGCDQEWFGTKWQRQAGCGPNVASNMMLYLHKDGRIRLPFEPKDRTGSVTLMEAVWNHVTPTLMGVHTIKRFANGVHDFAETRNIRLSCAQLEFPRKKTLRPAVDTVAAFISAGLDRDCPVAFLNLSNGAVTQLDAWHWVTIVQMDVHPETGYQLHIYDGDKEFQVDLATWCNTTSAGGGFVSLLEAENLG